LFIELSLTVDKNMQIYTRIFRYLDNRDLFSCRLVCQQWESIVKKALANRIHIVFDSVQRVESFMFVFKTNPSLFTNFFFKGPIPMAGSITQFFTIFGPYIRGLMIRQCIWMGGQLFSIMEKTPNLQTLALLGRVALEDRFYPTGWDRLQPESRLHWPGLKTLTLDLGGYTHDIREWNFRSDPGKIQLFVYHLLLAVPQLEKINCPGINECFMQMVVDTILFRNEISMPKLNRMSLYPTMGNFELRCLIFKVFPLDSLELDVQPCVSLNILHHLLGTLCTTLTYLKLRYHDRFSVVSQYFPSSTYLTKVKELYLARFHGPLCFLSDFVALQQLKLEDVDLATVFYGARGGPLELPPGFAFHSAVMPEGILHYTRNHSQ
jgi:hypothetical protein